MSRLGLLAESERKLDYVLGLTAAKIMERRLQTKVFKLGLAKAALGDQQPRHYFPAREIRALFEWTEPAEGETRKMLREQEGEERDKEAWDTANEDGATSDNWLGEWIAVGISDFKLPEGKEDDPALGEQPDALQAEMAVAKEKFALAGERTQRLAQERQAAEEQHRTTGASIAEAREAGKSFSTAARKAR